VVVGTRQSSSETTQKSTPRNSRSRLRRPGRTSSAIMPTYSRPPPIPRSSSFGRQSFSQNRIQGVYGIASSTRDEYYFIGFVDTLQSFDNVRRVENIKRRALSWFTPDEEAMDEEPLEYSFRLSKFMENITTTIPVFGQVPRYRTPNRKQYVEQNGKDPLATDEE